MAAMCSDQPEAAAAMRSDRPEAAVATGSEHPERAEATGSDHPEGTVEEATHSEPPGKSALDEAATVFVGVRRQLFGIAYRMLGSAVEAEDVVQEAWLRWQSTDRTVVLDPPAYLATVTTRLAINVAQSARVRRETYVGPWLPEPVDTSADPQLGAERGEAVELAVLLVLEKLTPTERAAYVLREAFDYPYEQIAAILETGQANARQLVSRARRHLAAERREPVDAGEHRRLLEAFLAAARTGDLAALEELLAADVVSYSDGGGVRGASRIPVLGGARVAKYLAAFAPRFWPGAEVEWAEANGRPAVLVSHEGRPVALLAVDASARGIERIMWVMNPAKLDGYVRSRSASREAPQVP
ncbi:RNA polymerase sigma-70 factor [Streptomyces phaeochromogenes]|uniref:RNA polymerase sigma-70 factor n=1 Tax=Streptomyces phaeochromogenes TaxID=1923 RepID=UPI0033D6F157